MYACSKIARYRHQGKHAWKFVCAKHNVPGDKRMASKNSLRYGCHAWINNDNTGWVV